MLVDGWPLLLFCVWRVLFSPFCVRGRDCLACVGHVCLAMLVLAMSCFDKLLLRPCRVLACVDFDHARFVVAMLVFVLSCVVDMTCC